MGGELAAYSGVSGSQYRAVARRLVSRAVVGLGLTTVLNGVRERSGGYMPTQFNQAIQNYYTIGLHS